MSTIFYEGTLHFVLVYSRNVMGDRIKSYDGIQVE